MTKLFISKKQIIKMNEFLENYVNIKYDSKEKMTHRNVNLFLSEKGIYLRKVNFDKITNEDLLNGNIIAVKDENNQNIVYQNPRKDLTTLYEELSTSFNKYRVKVARKEVLKALGLIEVNNTVLKKTDLEEETYELENNNRQKQFVIRNRSYYRKKHY